MLRKNTVIHTNPNNCAHKDTQNRAIRPLHGRTERPVYRNMPEKIKNRRTLHRNAAYVAMGRVCTALTWFRVAEYSGLTGRKGTALRSVTRVLWFCVVNHTEDTNTGYRRVCVFKQRGRCSRSLPRQTQSIHPHMHQDMNKVQENQNSTRRAQMGVHPCAS